jgi:hypothetical protein
MEDSPASIGDPYDTDPYVKRMLDVLESMIRERSFTQKRIQEELGWGASFVSQMRNQHKELRVDPLLKILMVIGVEPSHYFARVFAEPPETENSDPVATELFKKTTATDDRFLRLIERLVSKNLLTADEVADLIAVPAAPGKSKRRAG